jgi:DNA processing protein
MESVMQRLSAADVPPLLREIPQPPRELFVRGTLPPPSLTLLSVVGSRQYTSYGAEAVAHLIEGLRGYPIGIVSGLAIGIDGLAHEAALRANLYTLAIPGSGLSETVLYPARHRRLARRILDAGGGLLSEYPPDTPAAPWTFPQRNRLIAGISPATLLIEAGEKSGTLITARMATDYNRELMVVPGSIFSANSRGTHQFLKLGATPITTPTDIIEALRLPAPEPRTLPALSPDEQAILAALREPLPQDQLVRVLGRSTPEVVVLITAMELKGLLVISQGMVRAVI